MDITLNLAIVWLTAILLGSLDLVIFLGSKNLSSRAFSHSILWVTFWCATMGPFMTSGDQQSAVFFSRMTYFLGSTIATSFFYFFLTYPEDKKPRHMVAWSLVTLQIFFAYIFLFTDKVIHDVYPILAPQPWAWHFGSLSFLFELCFFGFFGAGIVIMLRKFKNCTDPNIKANLKYMLWVIIVGATPPSLMCIIFPRFGYFDLNWFGPVTELIWIPILSYSIIRYRQMNVKAVAAEVLAIAMTVILFINIFVDISTDLWISITTFIVFIILTFYLIKNILREAKQTELLKDLNDNLAHKVLAQTLEIRKSYDLEKHARRELEKLNETKDQFIMITQHHLRTPVTGIQWQMESLLSGANGPVEPGIRQGLLEANKSADRLMKIINDFLSITAIKVGGNILNLSIASLKPLVEDIFQELRIDIEQRRLVINYPKDEHSWPALNIDTSKIRDALLIIIENAVRYNIPGGKIDIETRSAGDAFELCVTDTGVGISNEDKEKVFQNLFHRGEKAREINPIGMGVGLSVAKAIIRAHHGSLEITSRGDGKGTRVTVRIPVDYTKNL